MLTVSIWFIVAIGLSALFIGTLLGLWIAITIYRNGPASTMS